MYTNRILSIVLALGLMIPAFVVAKSETSISEKADEKIAQVVGKDNVSTVKKVAIAAIAIPATWLVLRFMLSPFLKYQREVKRDYIPTDKPELAWQIFKLNGKDKTLVEKPAGSIKSCLQTVFWIKKYNRDQQGKPTYYEPNWYPSLDALN